MDTTFDLPCQSNLSSYACNVEDNKKGRRKRSSSYPYEGTHKEGLSKAQVLSQTAKLTTSSASHLHSTRGILFIILPIILFSAWVCNMWSAFSLLICIMQPVAIFVNHVHTIKSTQYFKQLDMPLTLIFPCVACEPATIMFVTLCHKTFQCL